MTNKMWGGRFQSGPDEVMEEINASIGFDKRLFAQDIAGSKAHAAMLAKQGIISKSDAAEITRGLDSHSSRDRGRHLHLLAGAGGYPPQYRIPPEGVDRPRRREAPHRTLA